VIVIHARYRVLSLDSRLGCRSLDGFGGVDLVDLLGFREQSPIYLAIEEFPCRLG
jgi:hypothetical protein